MDKHYEIKTGEVANLPLSLIDLDPEQPRKSVNDEYIGELAADIKAQGVLQPITVRPTDKQPGRFTIVYGECRYRSSKQAKKKTIPAILDTVNKCDLDRLLNQVKENCHRHNLSPIELAGVLKTLRDTFGFKSQAKMEDTLKEHGITSMGRSYISNTIRLLDLPDDLKEMINTGALTASHGKYLLQAMNSEKVLEDVRGQIANDPDMTTSDLQDCIISLYGNHHTMLTGHWPRLHFDYKIECVKTGCQTIRKVSGAVSTETFCLNKECFEKKQQAALDAEEENENEGEPKEISIAEDGSVDIKDQELEEYSDYRLITDANFDETECIKDCQHCHGAKVKDASGEVKSVQEACFNLTCWRDKTNEAHEQADKERKIRDSITYDIGRQIGEHITVNPELIMPVAAWLACGIPVIDKDDDDTFYRYEDIRLCDLDNDADFIKGKLISPTDFIRNANNNTKLVAMQVAANVIENLERSEVTTLANYCKVDPEAYQVNDPYLRHKTIAEICDMLQAAKLIDDEIRPAWEKKGLHELHYACTNDALIIGAPADVLPIYQQMLEVDTNESH